MPHPLLHQTAGRRGPPLLDAADLLPAPAECVGLLTAGRDERLDLLRRIAGAPGADALLLGRDDVLFPGLDVTGNIDFALATRHHSRAERHRQRASLLALLGMEQWADRRVEALDAEQRTACLLARAAASGHAVLLLDDPFAGLDDAPRARLQAMLRRLVAVARPGVVLAGASRAEMLAVSDRIGVSEAGQVRRLGTVAALFAQPASAAEAAAIAEANILTGRIESLDPDDDREAVVRLGCGAAMPAQRHPDVAPDGLCLLAVRPDHIAFAAMDAAEMGDGAMAATLFEHRHMGDQLRLRLRLADGTVLAVRRPAAALTARELERARLPNGAALAWRTAHATAFPHPEA